VPSSKPIVRFGDIIDNIDAIRLYIGDLDEDAFLADRMRVDAVERCLSRLSEAASKLGVLAEELEPDIPWRDIRDFGNFLRHDYDTAGAMDLWTIVRHELSPVRAAAERAVAHVDGLKSKD